LVQQSNRQQPAQLLLLQLALRLLLALMMSLLLLLLVSLPLPFHNINVILQQAQVSIQQQVTLALCCRRAAQIWPTFFMPSAGTCRHSNLPADTQLLQHLTQRLWHLIQCRVYSSAALSTQQWPAPCQLLLLQLLRWLLLLLRRRQPNQQYACEAQAQPLLEVCTAQQLLLQRL
jgi:hypothetical protein